jgi:putative NIF3 family GTP cyclohydrolase 1 type 2
MLNLLLMQNTDSRQQDPAYLLERRAFILSALKAGGATALFTIPFVQQGAAFFPPAKTYTVQEVIDIILKEIPGAPFKQTVDTLKSGQPTQTVSGIVTTMFSTIAVIEETARIKANFIIAHEPTFYNHTDDPNWVQQNEVVKQKQALLAKYQIAIWRFHDYWHSYKPDGIRYGVLKSAGWLSYSQPGSSIVQIPPSSLGDLVKHLKNTLQISHLRMIGDPEQICSKLVLLPGAAGGQMHISLVEKEKPDLLIVGEVHEWETAEYIRDARLLGSKTALIILGHSLSEEPGMGWLQEWLEPRVPELKVTHLPSGDPFTWI